MIKNEAVLLNENSNIVITIGMIVKNEHQYLRGCLQALQPLREAIPCELIITDTGSTDDTVAIAKEFGAEVRHFTWCDDFGAARNTTLKDIKGQWFLYIDADEYFDADLSALITLFKTGEHQKYRTIGFSERNYTDAEHKKYSDFAAFRLHRVYEGMQFEQKIHESLPVIEPFYKIATVLHHYGYIDLNENTGEGAKVARKKRERNWKLLEQEHKKNPESLRILDQMTDVLQYTAPEELQKKIEYLIHAFTITPQASADFDDFANIAYKLCVCYAYQKEYKKAAAIYEQYLQRRDKEHLKDLDLYYEIATVYREIGNIEAARKATQAYAAIYDAWQTGKFAQSNDLLAVNIICGRMNHFYSALLRQAKLECDNQSFAHAKQWIDKLQLKDAAQLEMTEQYTWIAVTVALAEQDMSAIAALSQEIDALSDEKAMRVLRAITAKNQTGLLNENSNILITIGMIVKNEHQYLRGCLQALQPLREAIPCELIITDTGSTDDTVAIAEEFGAEVRHFTWCDDFGAARNTTLKDIKGQWFLYIDADQYFDSDLSALITLFKTGEHRKYRTIGLSERNYTDAEHKEYDEFTAFRLHRVYQGMQFKQKIHESLPVVKPFCKIATVLHHYGYINFNESTEESEQGAKEKQKRNWKLLEEELKENPKSLRILDQLTDTLRYTEPEELQKKIEYLVYAFAITPQTSANFVDFASIAHKLCVCYSYKKEYEKEKAVYQQYLQRRNKEHLKDLDLYYEIATVYRKTGDIEAARKTTEAYVAIYDAWQTGKFAQSEDLLAANITCGQINYFYAALLEQAKLECDNQSFAQAKQCIEKLQLKDAAQLEMTEQYTWVVVTVALAEQDTHTVVELYQQIDALSDEKAMHVLWGLIENAPDAAAFFQAIGTVAPNDAYVLLNRLRSAEQNESTYTLLERLKNQDDLCQNPEYADILYYTIRMNYGVDILLEKLSQQQIETQAARLCTIHPDFTQVVLDYVMTIQSDNLQVAQLGRVVRLMEYTVFYAYHDDVVPAGGAELFEQLAAAAHLLAKRLYQPSIFSEQNLSILPPLYAMSYYAVKAMQARNAGDLAAYAHDLRETARVYPAMQKPIAQLAAQLQEELTPQKDPQKEFEELAGAIRIQTAQLIREGHLQEAEEILGQYTKVNPKDKDALQMYEALQRTRTAHKTAE